MEKLIDTYDIESVRGTYTINVYAELNAGRVSYRKTRDFEAKAELFASEAEQLNACSFSSKGYDSFDELVKHLSPKKSRIIADGMTEAEIVDILLPVEPTRRLEQRLQYRAWQAYDGFDEPRRFEVKRLRKSGLDFKSAVVYVRDNYEN